MKNTKNKIALVALTAGMAALGGCASQNMGNIKNGYMTNITTKSFPKTDPKNVLLIYKNQPDQTLPCAKYSTIGQVTVDTYDPFIGWDRSPETVTTNLKAGGASLGADAVININQVDEVDTGYAIKCEPK